MCFNKLFFWVFLSFSLFFILWIIFSLRKTNILPEKLNNHFNGLGVQFTKIWWPENISTLFGLTPFFEGMFKELKIKYTLKDRETEFCNRCYLIFYHLDSLNVGLRCMTLRKGFKKYFYAPDIDEYSSIFSKKLAIEYLDNLKCSAVEKESAEIMLNNDEVKRHLIILKDLLKDVKNLLITITDKSIKIKLPENYLPSKEVFEIAYNLSKVLTKLRIEQTSIKINPFFNIFVIYIVLFIAVFILILMQILKPIIMG